MVVSFVVTLMIHLLGRAGIFNPGPDAALLWTVGVTTFAWILVTFLTPSVDHDILKGFVRRIRPAGPGWRDFYQGGPAAMDSLPRSLLSMSLGCTFVYTLLFATGSFLYGRTVNGIILVVIASLSGWGLSRLMRGQQLGS